MAGDLIPPPSPAGRPQPEGTPRLIELPPDPAPAAEAPPPPAGPLPPSPYRHRFGFLMGALGGVVIAAALVFAVVLAASGSNAADEGMAPNWSKWRPSDTSIDGGAAQIAAKVGAEYHHPDGRQLVMVTGGRLPLELIVRPGAGAIQRIDGETVIYNLNGLGPNGSIKGGKPSAERLKVLQREALELSLYTFRYLPDVDGVVTLLPPPPPEEDAKGRAVATFDPETRNALFFRPGDLRPQLQVPLGATLSAKAPTPETLQASEARTIDTLTKSNRFEASVPTPPGIQLVLDRLTG